MGAIVEQLNCKQIEIDRELLGCSHSKLVQYYSSYKSISEGFTITLPQYTHIFGPNKLSFELWDTNNRAKVDALQMFSGIIIFSSIKYEQKVKFLFELFDFNEEGTLGYQNIALMILNIINASFKIFSIRNTIDSSAVQTFLEEYFTEESRITLQKLIRWTTKVNAIGQFFKAIGQDIEFASEEKHICELEMLDLQPRTRQVVCSKQKHNILPQAFLQNIKSGFKLAQKQIQNKKREKLNINLEWVFGINLGKQTVKYIQVQGEKAANERIVYVAGKLIIIYFPKLNVQQYYKQHKQAISVIQISSNKKLVASGEEGEYPHIHIWDFQTKVLLAKLKRLHKNSIQFLKFIKNDKLLASASQYFNAASIQTSIIIFNLQTKQSIVSTSVNYQVLGLGISYNIEKPWKCMLIGKRQITTFIQSENVFQMSVRRMEIDQSILCCSVNKLGQIFACQSGRKLIMFQQGQVTGRSLLYASESSKNAQEIVCLGNNQLAILDLEDIEILMLYQNKISRVQRLRLQLNLQFKIDLFHIQAINQSDILLVSCFGNLYRINNKENCSSITYQQYQPIFRLIEPISYYDDHHSNKLYIICSHLIYAIDRYQKEPVILMKFEERILKVTSNKHKIFLLCRSQSKWSIAYCLNIADLKINQTHRFNQRSEKKQNQPLCIYDIFATQNQLFAFSEQHLYIFLRHQDKYFDRQQPSFHKLALQKLRHVVPTKESHTLLLLNRVNQVFQFTIQGKTQFKIQKVEKLQVEIEEISTYYVQQDPLSTNKNQDSQDYNHPFCANLNCSLILLGKKNGDLFLWESSSQATSNQQISQKISFLCSPITQVTLSKHQISSTSTKDQLVILYKHNHYIPENHVEVFLQQPQCASSQQMDMQNNEQDYKANVVLKKTNQCNREGSLLGASFLKQSQVEISPLNESNKSNLRELIRDIINPKDKVTYQPQIQTQKETNATKLSLEIGGVLGISAMKSLGVFYTHRYSRQPHNLIDKSYWQTHHKQHHEQLLFASNLLHQIDILHAGCKREFVYAAGRLCVLRGLNSSQRIYQFHRRKVTCIAVHPQRQIMMSCEEGDPHPTIHIWDNQQISCRASIKALHNAPITRGSFSRQGQWLVTLGGRQGSQSFQIVSWQDEEIVNFVPFENQQLWDIVFNPYNDRELTVLGTNVIKVYKQQSARLILVDQSRLQQQFLCATYTSSIFGNSVESDLITGSRTGDIGIYICGKFIDVRPKAHAGAVACLRLAELFGYKKVLISGGDEGTVKIWDIKFNELSRKDVKEQVLAFNFSKTITLQLGISSLDVYQCLKVHEKDQPPVLLLIATTDGSVLQAKIENEFQGYKTKPMGSKEVSELKQKINFQVSVVFNGPPSLSGTRFEIFGQIMITYNNMSMNIQIWSVMTWQRIGVFTLVCAPAIIRFENSSPEFVAIYNKECQPLCHLYSIQFNGKLIKNITLVSEINLPKGGHEIVQAVFSEKDNRIALAVRLSTKDEILLYQLKDQTFELSGQIEGMVQTGKVQEVNYRALILQFSSEGDGLLVGWSDCSLQLLNQSFLQKEYIFRCYHVQTKSQVPVTHFDFKKIDFSRRVKANYLSCSHLGTKDHQKSNNCDLDVTVMAHYDCFLLLGTANGEILVVEADYFLKKQHEAKKVVYCFVVQDSRINSLYVRDSTLYVGAQKGEGIIQINLKCQLGWGINIIKSDSHSQNITGEWIKNKKDVYEKRKKIKSQDEAGGQDKTGGDGECDITLSLAAILGRNALYKRNNIFVDFNYQIVSFSGCNIIMIKNAPNKKMEQLIIKPDQTPNSIYPEIAAMALGDCKKKLVVGTAQENAKLLIWNISTKTFLQDIPLKGYCLITTIKLSSSAKHAAVIAVMPDAVKHLLFINLEEKRILGVSRLPCSELSVNDLCFVQGNEFIILGCGQNFMGEWQYKTGLLIHKRYSLDSSQDLSQIKANGIIFYSLIYVRQMAITSGSDGYLYIWKDGCLAKRQNAHPKAAVLSLYTSPNSRVFVSGGTDGRVVIWKIWPNLIIQQQKLYPKQGNLALGIQSVCMADEDLVVGDISGSIWIYPFNNEEIKAFQPLMSSFNNETINSCAFSPSWKRLYVVTASQKNTIVFSTFDTTTYLKLREEKLDLKSPLIKMISCQAENKIFFILQNAIAGFSVQGEDKVGKEEKAGKEEKIGKEDRGRLLKNEFIFKWQDGIKNAVISRDQKYLAVLMNNQGLLNCIIRIFCLKVPVDKFFKNFEFLHKDEKISASSSTNMIDFSTENDYLIFQGQNQDATIFNLTKKKNIKLSQIQNQLQWNDEAKKTTPAIAETIANFNEDDSIIKLMQVKNKCLIATDKSGSVIVFNYPKTEKGTASKVYIQHLNEVFVCVISKDERTMVTVGREDKSIHFWQINSN